MNAHQWLLIATMLITGLYAIRGDSKKSKRNCVIIMTIILACFSGLRSWQMGDVFHYCNEFLVCNTPGWVLDTTSSRASVGLQLFLHFAGKIGLSFENCLFIISAFVAISIGLVVYKYSPSPYWSYVMFIAMGFYTWSFDILKQSVAMGFVMLSVIPIIERRPILFLILTALGATFHPPALMFLLAYPFAQYEIKKEYFLVVGALLVGVFLFRNQIVKWMAGLYYDDTGKYDSADAFGSGRLAMMMAILALGLWLRPLRYYDIINTKLFNIMVIALAIQFFSVYSNVFTRLANYFYQFVVLYIPLILQSGEEQKRLFPRHAREIKTIPKNYSLFGKLFISAFSIWFYFRNVSPEAIETGQGYLSQFHFIWEVETPNSLDLLKDYITTHKLQ